MCQVFYQVFYQVLLNFDVFTYRPIRGIIPIGFYRSHIKSFICRLTEDIGKNSLHLNVIVS